MHVAEQIVASPTGTLGDHQLSIEGSDDTNDDADLAARVATLERHQRPSTDSGAHSKCVLCPAALLALSSNRCPEFVHCSDLHG